MSNRGSDELNIVERGVMELLYAACWLFSRLPHAVLYRVVAPFVCFIFHRVMRYRRSVIRQNLTESFPESSKEDIRRFTKDFYLVLSEAIVGTAALPNHNASMEIFPAIAEPREGGAAELREILGDRSWVALAAHFGMWEYLPVWTHYTNQQMLAVYHPLENRIFEALLKRFRGCRKVIPVPAKESVRYVVKYGDRFQGESYVLGLIADQNPPLLPESNWFNFLGRETIFFEGGERLARRAKLPVYFIYQRRTGRGRYEFFYRPIWDGLEEIAPAEITRRYVEFLEAEIRENPSMWLWSHRRWKRRRGDQERERWSNARGA